MFSQSHFYTCSSQEWQNFSLPRFSQARSKRMLLVPWARWWWPESARTRKGRTSTVTRDSRRPKPRGPHRDTACKFKAGAEDGRHLPRIPDAQLQAPRAVRDVTGAPQSPGILGCREPFQALSRVDFALQARLLPERIHSVRGDRGTRSTRGLWAAHKQCIEAKTC